MRIALASASCDDRTGIGRIVRSLARQFARADHDVTVVAHRIEDLPPEIHGVRFSRIPVSHGVSRLLFNAQTRRYFGGNAFDVVHAFGVGRGANIVSAQSCHAAAVEIQTVSRKGRISRRGVGMFDAIALRDERVLMRSPTTRHIIAVSMLVKDQLVGHYGIPARNVTVVPNGVDLERLAPPLDPAAREEVRVRLGFSGSSLGLLFVGNEFDRKGLQTVIEAIAEIGDRSMALAVIGEDDPAPYESLAVALGVRGQIRFLGGVSGPELYFRASDVLVLPAWYEPFGMVIAEAMAASLPVIATGSAGALEGLRHEEHALFLTDPFDADELARALLRVRDDQECRRTMTRQAQRETHRLGWDNVADLMLAAYAKVGGETPVWVPAGRQ